MKIRKYQNPQRIAYQRRPLQQLPQNLIKPSRHQPYEKPVPPNQQVSVPRGKNSSGSINDSVQQYDSKLSDVMMALIRCFRLWLPKSLSAYSVFVPFFHGANQNFLEGPDHAHRDPPGFPPGSVVNESREGIWKASCKGIAVQMRRIDIWSRFSNFVNEVVVNYDENHMFPHLDYIVDGLDPGKQYVFYVDFVPVDDFNWQYCAANNTWDAIRAAPKEGYFNNGKRTYYHKNSPAMGRHWLEKGIGFRDLKLTNTSNQTHGKVLLSPMRHYIPRLNMHEHDPEYPDARAGLRIFVMPKTAFVTVTDYQNKQLAKMKNDLNPLENGRAESMQTPALIDSQTENSTLHISDSEQLQTKRVSTSSETPEKRELWTKLYQDMCALGRVTEWQNELERREKQRIRISQPTFNTVNDVSRLESSSPATPPFARQRNISVNDFLKTWDTHTEPTVSEIQDVLKHGLDNSRLLNFLQQAHVTPNVRAHDVPESGSFE